MVIAGDFNQWGIGNALEDYIDLSEAAVGPTRGTHQIDRIFTNFGDVVFGAGTVPPLNADDPSQGHASNHRVATSRWLYRGSTLSDG